MKEILKLEKVEKTYQAKNGEIEALKDVSFSIKEGEFVSIIGPSGCGKSTLLSIIAGLEKKTNGKIFIDDKESEGISSKIGYMLQRDNLLEWRTIYKNVIFGLEITHRKTTKNEEYVKELLKKYNLYEFRDKYPGQLSGGMRQRVALIRTLAINPDILLLDEPFSALDYMTRLKLSNDVYEIIKKEKKTVILVTHDIAEAISLSDKVIVLTKRPSSIKNIYNIKLTNKTIPSENKKCKEFYEYYDKIWKDLDDK